MKKLLLSAVSLTALTGSAFAADLPSRKESIVAPPAPPMWTGFYAGLNAGGTWANSTSVEVAQRPAYIDPRTKASPFNTALAILAGGHTIPVSTPANFMGGVQFGYNEKVKEHYVVGLETDIQGLVGSNDNSQNAFSAISYNFRASANNALVNTTLYSTSNASRNISFIGTVRGRVGYLVQPNLLAYGTAGFAYGGTSLRYNGYQTVAEPPTTEYGPGASSHSQVNVGWTAGGGLEWMLSGNWSVKAEYLYYDLGTTSLFGGYNVRAWTGASSLAGVPVGSPIMIRDTTASTHFNGSIARAGVNYHFNLGSAPVVAKF